MMMKTLTAAGQVICPVAMQPLPASRMAGRKGPPKGVLATAKAPDTVVVITVGTDRRVAAIAGTDR
jgi:hypothetical protein